MPTTPGSSNAPKSKPSINSKTPVDVDQIDNVNDKIGALTSQLEAASDAFNQAQGQLHLSQAASAAADKQAADAKTALNRALTATKTMGHDLYVQGPLPLSTIAIVDAGSPQDVIDRLSMLNFVSAYQNGVLNDLIITQDAYQAAKTAAAQTTSEMTAADEKAKLVKQQLEADLVANQAKLAALQAGSPVAVPTGSPPPAAGQPGPVVGSWAKPATGTVTTLFEMRWGEMHYGVDIANSTGTPIYTAGSGVVKRAGEASGFGLAVYILHDNGDVTVYGHVDQIYVSEGQQVSVGQNIAAMGSRGFSTGPHLHFEVQLGMYGSRIDPIPWLATLGITL